MPSQVLHTLFGEDLTAEICSRLASRFNLVTGKVLEEIRVTHRKVFALGCQGPDIFYHSRGTRPVALEYGSLLHRRGMGVFTAGLIEMALPPQRRKDGINALTAYILGFMTHAMLDRLTHPYIVYKSSWISPLQPETARFAHSHAFFERIIDVLMLKLLRAVEISAWDQEGLLSEVCDNPPQGLKELLTCALIRAFPERAGKDEKLMARIENTFYDCAYFYRLTAPLKTAPARLDKAETRQVPLKKRHLVYLFPEELSAHIDFLNLEKRPWFYPAGDGEEDFRSFPELYAEALNTAADSLTGIFSRYMEEGFFPLQEAERAIGNAGLSIVDRTGKPCAPGRSDPLPLNEVIEQQAVLRGL